MPACGPLLSERLTCHQTPSFPDSPCRIRAMETRVLISLQLARMCTGCLPQLAYLLVNYCTAFGWSMSGFDSRLLPSILQKPVRDQLLPFSLQHIRNDLDMARKSAATRESGCVDGRHKIFSSDASGNLRHGLDRSEEFWNRHNLKVACFEMAVDMTGKTYGIRSSRQSGRSLRQARSQGVALTTAFSWPHRDQAQNNWRRCSSQVCLSQAVDPCPKTPQSVRVWAGGRVYNNMTQTNSLEREDAPLLMWAADMQEPSKPQEHRAAEEKRQKPLDAVCS
jgi:hypothetical protein